MAASERSPVSGPFFQHGPSVRSKKAGAVSLCPPSSDAGHPCVADKSILPQLMGGEDSAQGATSTKEVERPKNWKQARQQGWKPPVYTSDEHRRDVQKGFLTKVYGLLAAQLSITVAVCALFMLVPAVNGYVVGNSWLFIVSFLVSLICLVALFFLKNTYPWNMYLLFAFTVFESLLVGTVCALYHQRGMGEAVAIAWALTLVVFVALTIFVQTSQCVSQINTPTSRA